MTIVVATQNQHKMREMCMIANGQLDLKAMPDLSMPEETGVSFVENTLIKAHFVAKHVNEMVLADDSGLMVEALSGLPGVKSSRFAGVGATSEDNINLLCSKLQALGKSTSPAKFVCVMVVVRYQNDPLPLISEGVLHGEVRLEKRGQNGFGYDPIFYLASKGLSLAALPDEKKQQISHRFLALHAMIKKIND